MGDQTPQAIQFELHQLRWIAELKLAIGMVERAEVQHAKILIASIANCLRYHWCDGCHEYSSDLLVTDDDDRDLCKVCFKETDTWHTDPFKQGRRDFSAGD